MKKTLLFFALLCAVAQGAWAQNSWEEVYALTQTTSGDWTAINSGSTSGHTLGSTGNTTYYYVNSNLSFTNSNVGGSGLKIQGTVYLYVPEGVTLTCTGANANGQTGAGAGIELASGNTLYLLGGGTVNATGGNGGTGGDGGAGAGIGTRGGAGGSGGGAGGAQDWRSNSSGGVYEVTAYGGHGGQNANGEYATDGTEAATNATAQSQGWVYVDNGSFDSDDWHGVSGDCSFGSGGNGGACGNTSTSITIVTSEMTTMTSGIYTVLTDVTISNRITITGNVVLNLGEGATLHAPKGIDVSRDNSLIINGPGTLTIDGCDSDKAGIGAKNVGTLTINGGIINVRGGSNGAGIGGNVYIYGGQVTAVGGSMAAGIGPGVCTSIYLYPPISGNLTIGWTNPEDFLYNSGFYSQNGSYNQTLSGISFVEGKQFIIEGLGEIANPSLPTNFGSRKILPLVDQATALPGSGSLSDPYRISNLSDWMKLAVNVNGGIVAMPSGTLNIEGCAFTGRLLTNKGTHSCGGFVGWHNSSTISVINSLYAPSSSIPSGWSAITDGVTFVRGGSPTINNCYYTETLGTEQGKMVYTITTTVPTNLGTLKADYSMLKAYTNGILYDGTYYVTRALNGTGTEGSPYIIADADDWGTFVYNVNNGYNNYNGEFVRLDANINISQTIGLRDNRPFSGTFLGNGNTITASIISTTTGEGANERGVAPFHYINNATIKDLTVAGSIASASYHTSGIVGFANGTNTIEGCVVTATLNISNNYAGGIIGHGLSSNTTIRGCVFAGTINGVGDDRENIGGIWGWSNSGTPTLEDCLEAGTYTNIASMHPMGLQKAAGAITNCYYVTPQIGEPSNACTVNGV